MHIVQQVVVDNAPWGQEDSSLESVESGEGLAAMSLDNSQPSSPSNILLGPTVVMQLLESGTLGEFIDKAKSHGKVLPNRLLWRFFLCRK